MRSPRPWIPLLCVAGCLAVLAGGWALRTRAEGPPATTVTRWEYARLVFVEGQPTVLLEARRRATIQPPQNPLPATVDRQRPKADRYTAVSKTVHDNVAGSLNLVGAAGWEAVEVLQDAKTMIVLLKRPARK